jgi:hypothetical protein
MTVKQLERKVAKRQKQLDKAKNKLSKAQKPAKAA